MSITGMAILGQTKKDDLTHKLQSVKKMKPMLVFLLHYKPKF
jgi:hypothetical protein